MISHTTGAGVKPWYRLSYESMEGYSAFPKAFPPGAAAKEERSPNFR
jgi:hypothetical protein